MEFLGSLLLLASPAIFIVGMIKPRIFLKNSFGKYKDRLIIFVISIFLMILGTTMLPMTSQSTNRPNTKVNTETSAANSEKELFRDIEKAIDGKKGDIIAELLPKLTDDNLQQKAYLQLYKEYMQWIANGVDKDKINTMSDPKKTADYINGLQFLDKISDYRVVDLKKVKNALTSLAESKKSLDTTRSEFPNAQVIPGLLRTDQVEMLNVYVTGRLLKRNTRAEELISGYKLEGTNQFKASSYEQAFGPRPTYDKVYLIEFAEGTRPVEGVMKFYAVYVGVSTLEDANGFQKQWPIYREIRRMDIEYSIAANKFKSLQEENSKIIAGTIETYKKSNANDYIAKLGSYRTPIKKFLGAWINNSNRNRIITFEVTETDFNYRWTGGESSSATYTVLDISADESGKISMVISYNKGQKTAKDKLVYNPANESLTRYSDIDEQNSDQGVTFRSMRVD